jgi:hypothetical protein
MVEVYYIHGNVLSKELEGGWGSAHIFLGFNSSPNGGCGNSNTFSREHELNPSVAELPGIGSFGQ